jgi:hypothetical protein
VHVQITPHDRRPGVARPTRNIITQPLAPGSVGLRVMIILRQHDPSSSSQQALALCCRPSDLDPSPQPLKDGGKELWSSCMCEVPLSRRSADTAPCGTSSVARSCSSSNEFERVSFGFCATGCSEEARAQGPARGKEQLSSCKC